MLPYFFLNIYLIVFNFFTARKWLSLSWLVLFVFCAIRGNGDGDYFVYKRYALLVNNASDIFSASIPMEIGFRLLAFWSNALSLDPQFVIIAMAFISVSITCIVIKKYSNAHVLAFLVYFYYFLQFDLHASRTAVAASFGLCAILFFYEKEYAKFTLFFILSCCFHRTALILFFVFFTVLPLDLLLFGMLLGIAVEVLVGFDQCLLFFLSFFSDDFFLKKGYVSYLGTTYSTPLAFYDPRVLFPLAIVFICYLFRHKMDNFVFYLFKIYILALIVLVIFSSGKIFSLRLSYYLFIPSIVFLPRIAQLFRDVDFYPIKFTRVLLCAYFFTCSFYLYSIAGYVPYKIFIP